MKKKIIGLLMTFSAVVVTAQPAPDQLLSPLFEDVQLSGIFPDNKTFVDCTPKRSAADIVKDYLSYKNNPAIRFSLRQFVEDNFEIPAAPSTQYRTGDADIVTHIKELWKVLRREADARKEGSSLLPLPHPYIVPGGRFREIYYWDSYFTMLGLKESGETEIMENMIKNFAYMIETYGHIPNGNRTYYLSRSQPPFFSLMVELFASIKGIDVYKTYLPALEKEYAYWMEGADKLKNGEAHKRIVRLGDGTLLNRFWDDENKPRQESYREDLATALEAAKAQAAKPAAPGSNPLTQQEQLIKTVYRHLRAGAASGWDFSSRWFADAKNIRTIQTTDIIPVDLNCLILHLEKTLAKARLLSGNGAAATDINRKAAKRYQAIQQYCWNKRLTFFSDYNFVTRQPSEQVHAGGMYPFCFADAQTLPVLKKQAVQAVAVLKKNLLRPGGIVTTTNATGQQWDAPNGWAPLQWMTVWALNNTGQKELAKDIARRWMKLNEDVFKQTGKLMEKYNVEDLSKPAGGGEYPGQDGFGWTNGVYLAMKKLTAR